MKKAKLILFILLIYQSAKATSPIQPKPNLLAIQYIQIQDKALVHYVEMYVRRISDENKLFRDGLGFVLLKNVDYLMSSGRPLNLIELGTNERNSRIDISIQAYPLFMEDRYDCINCNYFPPYYTLIANKIVLIYENNMLSLLGRQQANDTHTGRMYSKKSMKKLANLVAKKAIIELPDNYTFDGFLEKNIRISDLKKRAKDQKDVTKFYEFIDFNASETIEFDRENFTWRKQE